MARKSLLIAAGVAAFLVFLVAMVPATAVSSRLPPAASLRGVSGTVWSGQAAAFAVQGHGLGALRWSCSPWRILLLEWSCRVTLRPAEGEVSAVVALGLGGKFALSEAAGSLPITTFEGIASPRGWTGSLELDVENLRLVGRRPVEASGRVLVRALKAPGPGGQPLGDFELVIGEGAVGTDTLTGRLRDLGGPLRVRGAIELKPDGSYLVSGEAAPGPGAGPAIFDTLAFLGPPDSQGRRPFTIEGTL